MSIVREGIYESPHSGQNMALKKKTVMRTVLNLSFCYSE